MIPLTNKCLGLGACISVYSTLVGNQESLAQRTLGPCSLAGDILDNNAYSSLLGRKTAGAPWLLAEDIKALSSLPMQVVDLRPNQDILREGDRPQRCCFMFEGLAAWSNVTGAGQRQILNFHIPGDIPDLQSLHLDVLDSTLFTLTPCKVAFVAHDNIKALCDQNSRVARYLWRSSLIEAAILRQWVTNLGGSNAYGRVAHLLCELIVRFKSVGLSDGVTCHFPITQPELADATGLSVVHLNRTLMQLRAEKLIGLTGETLTIKDWSGLQAAGDFDARYLHLP